MTTRDANDSVFDACSRCGAAFEPDVRYPTVTREASDGRLELYSFCDAECLAAWEARG